MSSLLKTVYWISKEDIDNVKAHYGMDDEKIKTDCCIVEDWMKQQAHFPDDFDAKRIESFLLRNKFRIEQTKKKLENYYTVKGSNLDFFKCMDPLDETMQRYFKSACFIPMPKLLNGIERVYVQRFTGNDDDFMLKQNSLMSIALSELELKYDYASGIRVIFDGTGFNGTHIKALSDINMIMKVVYMYQECLSGRILGIHYINVSGLIGTLLDILKIALPEKLYKKIVVHKDLDSLKKVIPEEYLPSDYGGKNRSNDEISADVKKLLLEEREYILQRINVISDESKRVGNIKKNDLFGTDGTFKQINID